MDDADVRLESTRRRLMDWVQEMVTQADSIGTMQEAEAFERRFRESGQEQMRQSYQDVMQHRVDQEDARPCPCCGRRRRHKGRRPRTLVSSLGAIRLEGIYWVCRCGQREHTVGRVCGGGSFTRPMEALLCLLGVTQSGFAHAADVSRQLLGVKLSPTTLSQLCHEAGRRGAASDAPPTRAVCGTLVGSCDGTMVHTREAGWRELRAYRFDDDRGRRISGAVLEKAQRFIPRLREVALSQHADQVKRFVFVSDAAEWIKQGVAEFLPEAQTHVIDIYHAYQHVHAAAAVIYGQGSERALAWAKRWCDELRLRGGRAVRDRLKHARFDTPQRQAALDQLLAYLHRHAPHLDYPRYRRDHIPISSGPMESTCKQLGLRLKGPGMRWNRDNVDPMAHLISLWTDKRWQQQWNNAA